MEDLKIESKIILNGKILNTGIYRRDTNEGFSHLWELMIFDDTKRYEFIRTLTGTIPKEVENAFDSAQYAEMIKNVLIQFREELPLGGIDPRMTSFYLSGVDVVDLSSIKHDTFVYPQWNKPTMKLKVCEILYTYFDLLEDKPIKMEYIFHSIKISITDLNSILSYYREGIIEYYPHHPGWYKNTSRWRKEIEEEIIRLQNEIRGTMKSRELEPQKSIDNKKVFIVHGHDDNAKSEVARFIEHCGLNPIILHEQPKGGRTITEQLEAHIIVGFAVVLLTGDDKGRANYQKGGLNKRARQNVILELGLFWGSLGRDKVHVLIEKGVERPSDFENVLYTDYNNKGAWKNSLFTELKQVWPDIVWPD